MQVQPTRPEIDAQIITVAEKQDGFEPIEAALVRHPAYPVREDLGINVNTHLLAFRPDDDQRAAIAGGADIYVSLLTGGGAMQGIIVMAGKEAASAIYNVPVPAHVFEELLAQKSPAGEPAASIDG